METSKNVIRSICLILLCQSKTVQRSIHVVAMVTVEMTWTVARHVNVNSGGTELIATNVCDRVSLKKLDSILL
jgi:hypothetical protein